jgi:hypothetical protein
MPAPKKESIDSLLGPNHHAIEADVIFDGLLLGRPQFENCRAFDTRYVGGELMFSPGAAVAFRRQIFKRQLLRGNIRSLPFFRF